MSSNEPLSTGENPTETPPKAPEASFQTLDLAREAGWPNPLWWAILAAVVVAVVDFGAGELGLLTFQPGLTEIQLPGATYIGVSSVTRRTAEVKGILARTALLGGLLGLGAGLAGGLTRRSTKTMTRGAVLGLLVGGAVSAAPVVPAMIVYLRAEDSGPGELTRAVMMHMALWLPVGAAAGLGLALGLGAPRKIPAAILGGLVGVALATLAYELLGSVVYPLAETGGPIAAEWQPRLLATLLIALGGAVGASALVRITK